MENTRDSGFTTAGMQQVLNKWSLVLLVLNLDDVLTPRGTKIGLSPV